MIHAASALRLLQLALQRLAAPLQTAGAPVPGAALPAAPGLPAQVLPVPGALAAVLPPPVAAAAPGAAFPIAISSYLISSLSSDAGRMHLRCNKELTSYLNSSMTEDERRAGAAVYLALVPGPGQRLSQARLCAAVKGFTSKAWGGRVRYERPSGRKFNPISAALGGAWRRATEWALFNDVLSVQGGPSTFAAVNEGFHRPARILCGIQVRPAPFDISAGLLDGIAYSDTSSRGCCLIRR